MLHEDPITHFDKDLDAEVIINSIFTDSFLRFKLFAFLLISLCRVQMFKIKVR